MLRDLGRLRLPAVTTSTARPATVMLAAGVDVLAVLVFAAVGRSSHAEMVDVLQVLTTASPFLIGLVIGWLVGRAWRAPLRLPVGTAVWAGATAVGLGVRATFIHRLPLTFVLVAVLSLALLLLGWRAVAHRIVRRRSHA
jgi:Protein of unknown function (DUF3054)